MEKQISQDPGGDRFWISNAGILITFSALRMFVKARNSDFPGKDLDLVEQLLADAAVTFASAVSEHGLPKEANRLLRRYGMMDIVEQ